MDMTEFSGSNKWLSADDFKQKQLTRVSLPVLDVSVVEYEDGKRQPVLHFKSKQFGLNKTNVKTMIALFGPDSEGWIGKSVSVYLTKTTYEGKVVDCLRIDTELPVKQIEQRPAQQNGGQLQRSLQRLGDAVPRQFVTEAHAKHDTSTTAPAPAEEGLDDEIPF